MRIFLRILIFASLAVLLVNMLTMAAYVAATPAYRAVWAADSQEDLVYGREPKTKRLVWRTVVSIGVLVVAGFIAHKRRDPWFEEF